MSCRRSFARSAVVTALLCGVCACSASHGAKTNIEPTAVRQGLATSAASGKGSAIKILALNDFHGQLSPRNVGARPAGGAAVLASYLKAASAGMEERTVIVHAGDHVGASPPNSALLQDEPAISVFNAIANRECAYENKLNPRCNLVGTLGNHEFDEGKAELMRLLGGGNHVAGPFLENPWRGARFPYVSANVVDAATGKPILPPYVVKQVENVSIAFIGAVLEDTPAVVTPGGIAGLEFLDEADAVNSYIPELHAKGVHAIVLLIHQGAHQRSYEGSTSPSAAPPAGDLLGIVSRLDDDIDVVVSGHTHQFTNAVIPNAHGVPMLVTQGFSASSAYADIDLVIDDVSKDVVNKTAKIVTTWADVAPGLTPDSAVARIVAQADAVVAPRVNRIIGQAAHTVTKRQNAAGESELGDLIADAQRASVSSDFAVTNPGGIRADLSAGGVTWGNLFTVQPFGNRVVKMTLTGRQIYDVLNEQWSEKQPAGGRILQISGFSYTWDAATAPGGRRVVEVRAANGSPISLSADYTMAVNSFLAAGGDGFTALAAGNRLLGPLDLDALVAYLGALSQPFSSSIERRIVRKN